MHDRLDSLRSLLDRTTVEFKEWQAWKEDVLPEHNFDIMFASWVFDDSADILVAVPFGRDRRLEEQLRRLFQPGVDGLIVESKLTLDFEKRRNDQPQAALDPREEQPYTFLWNAHQLQRIPQEGAARADPPLQVLLVRRRVVHPGERTEVM